MRQATERAHGIFPQKSCQGTIQAQLIRDGFRKMKLILPS